MIDSSSFSQYTQLTTLDLSLNGLKTIGENTFEFNTKLVTLTLKTNNIVNLPSSFGPPQTKLVTFDLTDAFSSSEHMLVTPYFDNFTALKTFKIGSNKFPTLNINWMPIQVTYLDMSTVGIETCPHFSSHTTSLTSLTISGNLVSVIPDEYIADLKDLSKLYAKTTNISSIPNITCCQSLTHVYFGSNKIPYIQLENIQLRKISVLEFSVNLLTEVPDFSHLPSLLILYLHRNSISVFAEGSLEGLIKLHTLYISYNKIATIPDLLSLMSLKNLIANDNLLVSIPDFYVLPLTQLYLARNPLECNFSLCWIRMSPWMKEKFKTDRITCQFPNETTEEVLMSMHPTRILCHEGE